MRHLLERLEQVNLMDDPEFVSRMEREKREMDAEVERTNPYNRHCPACGGVIMGRCRCGGPHDVEMLRNGHGDMCKNGHRSDVRTNLTIDYATGKVVHKADA
jgi:hypothetical protein